MTMVRERRQQQALRLSIPLPPPPPPSMVSPCHELSLASSPLAIGSDSPIAIDSLADIERLSVIGDGINGTVYKSRHRPTSALLALKILRLTSMDASHRMAREAEILMRLHSAYIVRCHAVLSDGAADQLCLVMEYMDSGSLRDVLLARPCLPEPLIAAVVQQVLRGLQYLHAMGVMHRDIKPSNILINGHGEIKIADFGASRKATDGVRQPCAGTCAYMSPERIDGEQYGGEAGDAGFAGDVWALGVVALECSAGRFPMVGPGERPDWPTLACAACFGEPTPEVPKGASPEFRGFVGRCLERDWRRRATADELLHHPFLANCGSCPEGLVSDSLSNKGKFSTSESNF